MRLSESKIKEAILHPEEEVRLEALGYFSRSNCQDNTLMPLVIQAVEKFGRGEKAFRILRSADDLAQTEETVQWLTNELAQDWDLNDVSNDNYCSAIALILCNTSVDLLYTDMVELPCFPEELKDRFHERLLFASWPWEKVWEEFEAVGAEARKNGSWRMDDILFASIVIERLAQFPEKANYILPLLHRNYRGVDRNLMEWLETFIVELAGKMRLEQAVPIIVERMHEDDWSLADSCQKTLTWIGGDVVVKTIAEHWQDGNGDFRRSAAEVLEHIHSDLSLEKCFEFFAKEEDVDTKDFLANALLNHFSEQAVELVRQMVLADDLNPDLTDLRYRLVATATIMGMSFPEYEQWYKDFVVNNWGRIEYEVGRIRKNFQIHEEDEDEEWEDDDDYEEDFDDDYEEKRLQPIRNDQERIGRNDPCPCGSGKKYKKCCFKK